MTETGNTRVNGEEACDWWSFERGGGEIYSGEGGVRFELEVKFRPGRRWWDGCESGVK